MKKVFQFFLLVAFMSVQTVNATDYYFSSVNGSDGNSGTSSGSPKQTISAMQTVINSLSAGDRVYLERGSVWYESSLTFSSITGTSGSPIVFDAYGSGNDPVLSGQKVLSSPSQSGNIYTFTDGDIPNINLTSYTYGTRVLGYVTVGGTPYVTSRHPNTGYYQSTASSISSVTDDLSWSTNEWQNGFIAMKVLNWQWSLARVSSNTSTTLTTTQHAPFTPSGEKYYFFLNAYNALDQDGEWYWSNGSLAVYWAGTLPEVKASVVDNIITISYSDYIQFNNIEFVGANHYCASIAHGDYNTFDHCRFVGAGEFGVYVWGASGWPGSNPGDSENSEVTNSEIVDCGLGGIFSRYARGGNYSNNYIHRIGINAGYNNKSENRSVDGYAIYIWNNMATDIEPVARQNFIDSVQAGFTTHYNGYTLNFRENFIRNYGLGDLTDAGGIYVTTDSYSSVNKKKFYRNFFLDVHIPTGAHQYSERSDGYTHALYTDQDIYGTKCDSNSIENSDIAIKTNGGKKRSFNYNNILNPGVHFDNAISNNYIFALNDASKAESDTFIYNHIVLGTDDVGYAFNRPASTYECSLPWKGEIDYNKWFDPAGIAGSLAEIYDTYSLTNSYTFSQWQAFSDNCSGDVNDPGDNSTYNTSYSNAILLKNWSASAHSFPLSASYVDVDGNTVTGSTSVPAFYSKLLFKTSGTETNSDIYADTTLVPNLTNAIVGADPGDGPTTYTLTISYSGTGSGSVSPGSGSYNADTTLSLTATPNSGSIFAGWSGDTTATINPLSVVMWTNKSITATFTDTTSVPESDTIAYWRFENNANDEMGNYDATLYGSPTYESSSPAEGSYNISFDGTGRYADCGAIELGSSFSISGYVKIWASSGTRPLFATTSASSPDGIYATLELSTGVFSLITGDGSSSATATSTSGHFTSGSWIKFEYIVDGNSCTIKVNDSDVSSATTIVGGFTDNKTFYIGRDAAGSVQTWGRFDAVMIVGGEESEPDPTVTITATDNTATEESETTGTFRVSRGSETSGNLAVNFSVSGTATLNTDYTLSTSSSVTISDGNTYADITVTPDDDAIDESDETVILSLSSGSGYTIGSPSSATVTIIDDDATVTITATDATATEASETTGTIRVSRGAETLGNLTVNFTTGGTATLNTDYILSSSSSVTISDGNTYADIIVTPDDDATDESDETVILTLSSGSGYTVGSPSSATVTIIDDDEAELDTIGKINFTFSSYYDVSGWNNVYTNSTFNENLGDGVYFSTSETLAAGVNGEPSTVLPANAGSTYHYIGTADNTAKYYNVSGLDTTHSYCFSFFESRDDAGASGDRTTTYTIGGSSVGVNPVGNTDSLVTITGVEADASGEVDITVTKISGQYGYINALFIIDEGLKRAKIRSDKLVANELDAIRYYPVPVENQLNLKNVPAESMITVYDVVGNKVYQMKSGLGNDLQLDMSKFRSGMYLVRIVNELSLNVNTFKVLKK